MKKASLPHPGKLSVLPVTQARWPDLETVFAARGCSIARCCWCMAYRRSGAWKPPNPGMNRSQANRAELKALVDAGKHGATLIEAYPVDKPGRSRDDAMWFGAMSMYDRAGFEEVARRKPMRPVVRLRVK